MKEIIRLTREKKTICNETNELNDFENEFIINKYDKDGMFIFEIMTKNSVYFKNSLFTATKSQVQELIEKCQEALKDVKN